MTETDARLAIVTETWMGDKDRLEEDALDLDLGSVLGMLSLSRPYASNGVMYGGVALIWRNSLCQFKEVKIRNSQRYEVLVGAGSIPGHRHKLVVLACYSLP